MSKQELLIEVDVVRSGGHDGTTVYVGKNAEVIGRTVVIDNKPDHHGARSLAQIARRQRERYSGIQVATIVTNEAERKLVAGVSGSFNFRTKS
jgi:hypothetical protein